jgi:2-C-methyl-D-erythritol 2,4-cyclodiphosphate synthase
MNFRVGLGYDSHKLVDKNINQFPFLLGGVEIPFEKSCIAHSDGDVLIHALCDALLGAAALQDIGTQFPDNDPKYKNCNSKMLLENVAKLISQKGWLINNIDVTIIIEKPKLATYKELIKKNIASILDVSEENISIKAKTNEQQDSVGRGESVVAHVIVSIISKQ